MQRYTNYKYIFHKVLTLLLLCLLTLFFIPSNAQTVLKFGDNLLPTKRVQYGKYTAKVTPTIQLKSKYINSFTIVIKVTWFDKKNRQVENIDGFVYLIDDYDNLNIYCGNNKKIPEDERKGVLKYDFTSSVILIPGKNLKIGEIKDGFVNKTSNPIKVEIREYFVDPITLDIILYFGKVKKDELIILANSPSLKWKFNLPVRTSDEGLSCDQLIRKYTSDYNNSKPDVPFYRYEDKYITNSEKNASVAEWQQLDSLVLEYKLQTDNVSAILELLKKNKDTVICKKLNKIKHEINNYLIKTTPKVNLLKKNIDKAIANYQTVKSDSPAIYVSPSAFKKNAAEIDRYYNALWELDYQGEVKANNPQFIALKDSVLAIEKLQDSLINLAGDRSENAMISFSIKKFNQNYNAAIEIIKKYEPESEVIYEAKVRPEDVDTEPGKKAKRFPYWWIVIPLIIVIIAVIGIKKFFPHLLKLKKADKAKGRFKR